MITLSGVTKNYGQTQVIKGIDLEVRQGEFLSLLGPSGCGKTTLLRCLAGLETIDGGEIRIGGKLMSTATTSVPPEDRNLGMIFQSYALWPHMTVAANIAYGLKLRKLPAAEIAQRVQEALTMVGLQGYDKRYPVQLSGGQQQRVALARSVAMRPQVLLFDEPLSNLDAQLRNRMREELRDLQQLLGTTAVYVTHDQSEAMAASDRIVLMREGCIVQQGEPQAIYARPATAYAASFLGSVNFIPARYDGKVADRFRVTLDGGNSLELFVPGELQPGDRVLLGIRHEEILVNQGTGPNTFSATITKSVFMGATLHLDLEMERLQLRAVIPSRTFRTGEIPATCLVTLPAQQLMFIPVDDLDVMKQ
jgi:iron(III) transport system ATP-binding protein